jgi:hypothetical protein
MNEGIHADRTASEPQDRVTELIEQQTAMPTYHAARHQMRSCGLSPNARRGRSNNTLILVGRSATR